MGSVHVQCKPRNAHANAQCLRLRIFAIQLILWFYNKNNCSVSTIKKKVIHYLPLWRRPLRRGGELCYCYRNTKSYKLWHLKCIFGTYFIIYFTDCNNSALKKKTLLSAAARELSDNPLSVTLVTSERCGLSARWRSWSAVIAVPS